MSEEPHISRLFPLQHLVVNPHTAPTTFHQLDFRLQCTAEAEDAESRCHFLNEGEEIVLELSPPGLWRPYHPLCFLEASRSAPCSLTELVRSTVRLVIPPVPKCGYDSERKTWRTCIMPSREIHPTTCTTYWTRPDFGLSFHSACLLANLRRSSFEWRCDPCAPVDSPKRMKSRLLEFAAEEFSISSLSVCKVAGQAFYHVPMPFLCTLQLHSFAPGDELSFEPRSRTLVDQQCFVLTLFGKRAKSKAEADQFATRFVKLRAPGKLPQCGRRVPNGPLTSSSTAAGGESPPTVFTCLRAQSYMTEVDTSVWVHPDGDLVFHQGCFEEYVKTASARSETPGRLRSRRGPSQSSSGATEQKTGPPRLISLPPRKQFTTPATSATQTPSKNPGTSASERPSTTSTSTSRKPTRTHTTTSSFNKSQRLAFEDRMRKSNGSPLKSAIHWQEWTDHTEDAADRHKGSADQTVESTDRNMVLADETAQSSEEAKSIRTVRTRASSSDTVYETGPGSEHWARRTAPISETTPLLTASDRASDGDDDSD